MTIASAANISCRPFDGAFASGFYGRYACAPNGEEPVFATNGTASDPQNSSSGGGGGLSRGAILALEIIFPILSLIFWICVIWWLVRRRSRHRREILALQKQVAASQNPNQIAPSKPDVFVREKPELDATSSMQKQAAASTLTPHELESPSGHTSQSGYSPSRGQTTPYHQVVPGTEPFARMQGLDAREEALAERERLRLVEELSERERVLAEREKRMEEWERERGRNGGGVNELP